MVGPMRRRVTFLIALFALVRHSVVVADGPSHTRIPNLSADEVAALVRAHRPIAPPLGDDASGPNMSNGLASAASESEPRGPSASPAGRRMADFSPDRETSFEGNADYFEVFSPAIAPYKRVSSLDAVVMGPDGRTPVLAVASRRLEAVPIEDAARRIGDGRARDSFWGTVTLDFSGGTEIPLPSVSPESRVLGVLTEPNVELSFGRDSAGNYVARTRQSESRSIAVRFLMDAPRDTFGGPIPDGDFSSIASRVPTMPESVRVRALRFAGELGLSRRSRYKAVVDTLVSHFRSFVESDVPPSDSGDTFSDLARGKRGVCRHRAYAFVITAQALGIPSRFLSNEAHAWVEVMLPSGTWRRIDLGGAAAGLVPHRTANVPQYDARLPDALPTPPEYIEAYRVAAENARAAAASRAAESSASSASGVGGGAGGAAPVASLPASWRATETVPQASAGAAPRDRASNASPVSLTLDDAPPSVFRGRQALITGRVADGAGAGAPSLRVEVSLVTSRGDRFLPLGVTVTDERGRFAVTFSIPHDVPPGEYRLYVATPGDARYQPAAVE